MILPSQRSFLVSVDPLGIKYQKLKCQKVGDITLLKLKQEKPKEKGCELEVETQTGGPSLLDGH